MACTVMPVVGARLQFIKNDLAYRPFGDSDAGRRIVAELEKMTEVCAK